MSWLIVVSLLAGMYFLFLTGYRLFQSGRKLTQEAMRTSQLLTELSSFDRTEPRPATAHVAADFEKTLLARRRLVRKRARRRENRERRLVRRIREIDVDKRWS